MDVVFHCGACGLAFYQNSIPSATVVIPNSDDPSLVLLITRNTPPGIGLLALPGGFLRYDEPPHEAAVRETREEIGVAVDLHHLLCATLVRYPYEGSLISVLELAYVTNPKPAPLQVQCAHEEIQEAAFVSAQDVLSTPERLAFPEQVNPLRRYLATLEGRSAP